MAASKTPWGWIIGSVIILALIGFIIWLFVENRQLKNGDGKASAAPTGNGDGIQAAPPDQAPVNMGPGGTKIVAGDDFQNCPLGGGKCSVV